MGSIRTFFDDPRDNYMKKVDILPYHEYDDYACFSFRKDSIFIIGSTLNFNPKDSIIRVNHKHYFNVQYLADTLTYLPGLTKDEYLLLKKNLNFLRKEGVSSSSIRTNSDGRFQLFYYEYNPIFLQKYEKLTFMFILPEDMIRTKEIPWQFYVLESIDDLYFAIIR